jgi:hypothetical protein
MKAAWLLGAVAASAVVCTTASAYELETHAAITWYAYLKSKLASDSSLRRDLGIDRYHDPVSGSIKSRSVHQYEQEFISQIGVPELTVPGWRGAVREDDSGGWLTADDGEPLHDGPWPNFNRWCNHFFDPTKPPGSRKADFWRFSDNYRHAANWAAGTVDLFGDSSAADGSRKNHFSIKDAREALYRAVTGKASDGTSAGASGETTFTERKGYYATMFRALGDVMYLNQDMAQPRHTRNEPHAAYKLVGVYGNPIYEKYIEARVTGRTLFHFNTLVAAGLHPLTFGSPSPIRNQVR